MLSSKFRIPGRFFDAFFLFFLLTLSIWAQNGSNLDSPILISEPGSSRALVTASNEKIEFENLSEIKSRAVALDSEIALFVTNLDLPANEAANAFRVYAEDARGRMYRFPVTNIEPLQNGQWIYKLTVLIRDELEFYEPPGANGDVLIAVTWRGMASNRLRLGLGKTGGAIKDDTGVEPSPPPLSPLRIAQSTSEPDSIGDFYSADRVRFMEQATFGPTDALDKRIRRLGLSSWLAEQFDAPYPTVPFPDIPLMPSNEPGNCNGAENPNSVPPDPPDIYPDCRRDRYTMFPVQNWFFKEAFYGDAQLRHRVSWALSQMWVVSGVDTQQSSHMINYYQTLGRNAFGNYRTLMREMTLNAAMGNYLDMMRSTKDSPNENYAREILQLFSIGVFMLNPDGTLKLHNGAPIPTYNQQTINNFTKVFTGWSLCEVTGPNCPNRSLGAPNYKDPMLLNQTNHDTSAKTLLDYPNAVNKNIAADLNGNAELELALDNIYNHPNVAPFVSRFLIQHLVVSDPTPAYVGRVAAVFNQNRTNPTQLKQVIRAILLDPEARGDFKTDPNYGKLREPVQLATNLMRHFNVRSADGTTQSDGWVNQMIVPLGQNTFYSPTVFNFYAPDYIVPGPGLNGPEFGIMTTSTAVARINFVHSIVYNRVNPGANSATGTAIDFTEMRVVALQDHTANLLIDTLNRKMMHGRLTAQNKAAILQAIQKVPRANPLLRAQMATYLIATSSQYQVQR